MDDLLQCPNCGHSITKIEREQACMDYLCPKCQKIHLSKFDIHQSWQTAWQEGNLELDAESIEWIRSRPDCIKKVMLKFPPSCIVRSDLDLLCPALGCDGIVSSYFEPDSEHPDGMLSVRSFPDAEFKAQCRPEWLKVVGYYKGLTPERIKEVLSNEA